MSSSKRSSQPRSPARQANSFLSEAPGKYRSHAELWALPPTVLWGQPWACSEVVSGKQRVRLPLLKDSGGLRRVSFLNFLRILDQSSCAISPLCIYSCCSYYVLKWTYTGIVAQDELFVPCRGSEGDLTSEGDFVCCSRLQTHIEQPVNILERV